MFVDLARKIQDTYGKLNFYQMLVNHNGAIF